jgi:hypothetical protein
MPKSVDAVLSATATTLMWRGFDRGTGLSGIRSSSEKLPGVGHGGTNEPVPGDSSTPASPRGLQA